MFKRRSEVAFDHRPGAAEPAAVTKAEPPPLKPFSAKGVHVPLANPATIPLRAEVQRPVPDIPGTPRRDHHPQNPNRLIVGKEITLSGAISACAHLVVEGTVEADLTEAESLEVTETGTFRGKATLSSATVNGTVDGALHVKGMLTIGAKGQVKGTVSYRSVSIAQGGKLCGTVTCLDDEG